MSKSDFEVQIRKACKDDVAMIVELWKEFMDFHKVRYPLFSRSKTAHGRFEKFIGSHMVNRDSCVLVAQGNNQLLGYCLATVGKYPPVFEQTRYGCINDLAVTKTFRRQGIGEQLFLKAKEWFQKRGLKRMEVRVAIDNEVSTRFWRKAGFQPYLWSMYMEE